ncbi:MAG TPA: hypothetical protein VHI11_07105 [Jiangellaceae bacterium]|nr:hypothetical protein [Jiangellaceae bacterium]
MTVAAEHRSDEDGIPDWLAALWRMVFVLEAVWVILANLAAAGYGVAIVRTDVLPSWLGLGCDRRGAGHPDHRATGPGRIPASGIAGAVGLGRRLAPELSPGP